MGDAMMALESPVDTEYRVPELDNEAVRRIAAAIYERAIKDAAGRVINKYSDSEDVIAQARWWLMSKDGVRFAEILGINPDSVVDWIKAGCHLPDENRGSKTFDKKHYQA